MKSGLGLALCAVFLGLGLAASVVCAAGNHVVDGVNFDEMTYKNGPCEGDNHMHLGKFENADVLGYGSVEDVKAGVIGGIKTAIVTLYCSEHAAYDIHRASLFEIAHDTAKEIAAFAGFTGQGGEGFADGPFPEIWIYASYKDDRLYVDMWNQDKRCDRRSDWIASTYGNRNGKVVQIFRELHHRAGLPRYCNPQGRP